MKRKQHFMLCLRTFKIVKNNLKLAKIHNNTVTVTVTVTVKKNHFT